MRLLVRFIVGCSSVLSLLLLLLMLLWPGWEMDGLVEFLPFCVGWGLGFVVYYVAVAGFQYTCTDSFYGDFTL